MAVRGLGLDEVKPRSLLPDLASGVARTALRLKTSASTSTTTKKTQDPGRPFLQIRGWCVASQGAAILTLPSKGPRGVVRRLRRRRFPKASNTRAWMRASTWRSGRVCPMTKPIASAAGVSFYFCLVLSSCLSFFSFYCRRQ